MSAFALFQQLYEVGMVLQPYPDGTLRYKAPKVVLTPELLDAMRRHKEGLLALLAQPALANDAPAITPSTQATCIYQAHVPSSPPPYPGRPVGAPFRPGHQVWL